MQSSAGLLPEPEHCAADRDDADVVAQRFLVTRCKASRLLEQAEGALDFGTRLVQSHVAINRFDSISSTRDHSLGILAPQGLTNFVAIVRTVCKQTPCPRCAKQGSRGLTIVTFAFRNVKPQWQTDGIDNEVNLRAQSAAGTAYRLRRSATDTARRMLVSTIDAAVYAVPFVILFFLNRLKKG